MIDPDIKRLEERLSLETHKVIACGVAASHPDASLAHRSPYIDKWDSPQAESVRKLRGNFDSLRAAVRRVLEAQRTCLERRTDETNTDIEINPWLEAINERARAIDALRAEMAGIDGEEQKP